MVLTHYNLLIVTVTIVTSMTIYDIICYEKKLLTKNAVSSIFLKK